MTRGSFAGVYKYSVIYNSPLTLELPDTHNHGIITNPRDPVLPWSSHRYLAYTSPGTCWWSFWAQPGNTTFCSDKPCPFLYGDSRYKNGQDFVAIQLEKQHNQNLILDEIFYVNILLGITEKHIFSEISIRLTLIDITMGNLTHIIYNCKSQKSERCS